MAAASFRRFRRPFRRRSAFYPSVQRDTRWSALQFYINTNLTVNAGSTQLTRQDIFIMNTLSGTGSSDIQLALRKTRVASIVYSSAWGVTAAAAVVGSYGAFFESVCVDELGAGAIPVRGTFDQSFNSIGTPIFDSQMPTKVLYRDHKILPVGDSTESANMPRYVNNGTRKIKVRKSLNDQQCLSCYCTVKNAAAAQIQVAWSIAGVIYYRIGF